MKTTILLFILSMFYSMNIKAIEKDIYLYKCAKYEDKWIKDKRSISRGPTATINKNLIQVCFSIPTENIQVTIKDEYDNSVYCNSSLSTSQCHNFYLTYLPDGKYTIEIDTDKELFYGVFTIRNM